MGAELSAEAAFDALGDPTRRAIIRRLRSGPVAVGELAADLPVGRPAVSKHLKVLGDAGLVTHTTVGTRNLYALAPEGYREVQQWLVQHWDTVLDAFASHVHDVVHEEES